MVDHASWTRKDLADPGLRHPFTVTDAKPDNALSISSEVIRGVHEGRRAVIVPGTGTSRSSYTKPQIDALVDLLHLYRCMAPPDGVTVTSELDIILGGAHPEASDALFTLVRSLKGAPAVRIFDYRRDGTITELADDTFRSGDRAAHPGLATFAERGIAADTAAAGPRRHGQSRTGGTARLPHALPTGMVVDPAGRARGRTARRVRRVRRRRQAARKAASARHAACGSKLPNQACQEMCEPTIPAPSLPLPGRSHDSPQHGSTRAASSKMNTRWNHGFSAVHTHRCAGCRRARADPPSQARPGGIRQLGKPVPDAMGNQRPSSLPGRPAPQGADTMGNRDKGRHRRERHRHRRLLPARHQPSRSVPPVHPRRNTPAWLVPGPGPRRRRLPRGNRRPRPHGRQRPPRPPRRPTKHLQAIRRRTD